MSKSSTRSANTTNLNQHDLEINSLLNRLHSGCRFIDFDKLESSRDGGDGGGGGGNQQLVIGDANSSSNTSSSSNTKDTYNILRNLSSPDEIHAELGRGLAHSYLESILHCSVNTSSSSTSTTTSLFSDKDGGHAAHQTTVQRGERILTSLCCGEQSSLPNNYYNKNNSNRDGDRLNYASTACAYFHSLISYCSINTNDNNGRNTSNASAVLIFLRKEWPKWCVLCEELAFLQTPSNGHGGGVHVLHACLKYCSHMYYLQNDATASDDNINDESGIARVYEKLMHQSSRKYLIRTCIDCVFHIMTQTSDDNLGVKAADSLVMMVSPLLYSCILAARKSTTVSDDYHAERHLLLQDLLKKCSFALLHDRRVITHSQIASMVQHLTSSLVSYLNQSVHATFSTESSHLVDILELSYEWLCGICDIIQCIFVLAKVDSANIDIHAISTSMEQIVTFVLPQFTTTLGTSDPSIVLDMTSLYTKVNSCLSTLPRNRLFPIANATVLLRLGALILTLQDDDEVTLMLDMILSIMGCLENTGDVSSNGLLIGGLLTSLGCIYQCRPACFNAATRLYALGESLLYRASRQNNGGEERKDEATGLHLMDVLCHSMDEDRDFSQLLNIVSASISVAAPPTVTFSSWQRRPLLFPGQCAGLLIGLSLLYMSVKSPKASTIEQSLALTFLQSLLHTYPRIAPRVVPTIIDLARECLTSRSTQLISGIFLESLDFLSANCIVSDAHGAHLSWTFLASLATDEMPPAIRSTVIRRLPSMCSGNKRLFRRVIDIIGKSMLAQDPIIRLAATAALSDMAKLDLIRDVENIVGLIQSRLIDEEPAVLYYALEVLRYFVVNEELEFDLVVRVLEKRLSVDLSNVSTIMSLDSLVVEGLAALLGQGGFDDDDDDDDDDGDEKNSRDDIGPTVSSRTIKAVSLLVELALLPQLSIKSSIGQDNEVEVIAKLRIQRAIHCSLAGYSAHILGLDSESIRLWDGVASLAEESDDLSSELKRYLNLKEIASNGFDCATKLFVNRGSIGDDDGAVQELLESAATIGKSILKFEEDVHGSFLFRSSHSSCRGSDEISSRIKADKSRIPKSVISSLPTEAYVEEKFRSDPRSATAVAMLYSTGFSDDISSASLEMEDILLTISECLGDVLNEPLEPMFHTMQICSLIHSMSTLWKYIQFTGDSVKDELLNQVLAQLDEWSEIHGDSTLVAMAAFFLAVDDSAHQHCSGLARIQQTIVEGDDNHLFQSEDTKLICLGMVAARMCRDFDSRVPEIIDSIERSLLHSRQNYFGSLFGLSVIMKNLSGNEYDTDSSAAWRREQAKRVICIFLSFLNTCLAQESEDLSNLISSIESDYAASKRLRSRSNSESIRIQDGCALKLKSVLLAVGISCPALRSISRDLLNCILTFVDNLPWGTGKGVVLYSAYHNAIESEAITLNDLSDVISRTSEFIQGASVGVGDALLSLALLCQVSPNKSQKELEFVADKCHEILLNKRALVVGDDKLLSILAGCAVIGELPGISFYTPTIHGSAKKSFVASYSQLLVDMASNDDLDQKCKDASMIGIGMLCAMRSSGNKARVTDLENKLHRVQTKEGTMMQTIFQEIEKTYSLLLKSPPIDHQTRSAFVKKLCALFSTLESIALPGSFASVIELTLNVPITSIEEELKASSMKLLVSQLESRRRIGFDGRGFADLSTRLAKMAPDELNALVSSATPILMTSLPNLLCQLPTSIAEEVAASLWAICRYEIMGSSRSSSAEEFLLGIQIIMGSINDYKEKKHAQRKSLSPALLRTIRKFIAVDVFSDLCTAAMQNTIGRTVWISYLQCLQHIPDAIAEIDILNCDISWANVFGMSTVSMVSPKSARRVESWISLLEVKDIDTTSLHLLLLSIINIAIQPRDEIAVKESILSHFEVMLVKGIDTMSIYIIAAKIAFWWENLSMNHLQYADMPLHRVSNMSSFFVNERVAVGAEQVTPKLLVLIFDAFVTDLPSKIAVLCHMWRISEDVSNRAYRIVKAARSNEASKSRSSGHTARAMACMKEVAHLLSGGEQAA